MAQFCWAEVIGGCAGGLSREHIISASQFRAKSITLQGLPWCREPKTVGIGRLVSKNLCMHHNSALSEVDNAAKLFMGAIFEAGVRRQKTQAGVHLNTKAVAIDGVLLERWFLKTTINLVLQGEERDPGVFEDEVPRRELVEIAFGQATFPQTEGLHAVAEVGEQIDEPGSHRFETLVRNQDGAVVGSGFRFHGHRFWLALDGAPKVNGAFKPLRKLDMGDGRLVVEVAWSR